MATNNLVSSDIFDLTEFVKQMKKEYIPVDNEDTLYTSTFGYMGEIAANLMQNSIIAASEYSNEAIPTRAKFDRNVIIHAMTLGIDKVHAIPATMPVVLAIPESCVVQNLGNNKTGTVKENVFTIDKTIPFNIEGVEFHLDYDIKITRYKKEHMPSANTVQGLSEVIYTARYDMTDPNPLSDIDTEVLPTVGVFNYADIFQSSLAKADNVLVVYTRLSQVIYDEHETIISTDNDILNKTLSFQFDNQLAYFDVAVYEANSDTPTILTPVYDGLYKDGVTNYCYYSYMNSNSIRIRFDRDVLQPKMNSKVIVRVYTTLGSGGNFNYSENLTVRLPSTTKVDYNSVYVQISQRSEGASGGLDRATTKELQRIIPKEMLSRGFITTCTDLQNYFNSLSTENNVVYVYRKEDSFLKRTYYTYSLLKDNSGNVLPTNTVPVYATSVETPAGGTTVAILESGTPIYMAGGTAEAVAAYPLRPGYIGGLLPIATTYDGPCVLYTLDHEAFPAHCVRSRSANNIDVTIIETERLIDYNRRQTLQGLRPIESGNYLLTEFDSVLALDKGFTYTSPYSIIVSQPTATTGNIRPRCSFIIDTINDNKYTTFDFINDTSTIQFMASNVKVTRPSYLEHDRYAYYMDIDLTPNQTSMGATEWTRIQATAVLFDGESPVGYVVGYYVPELSEDGTLYHFRFRFETEELETAWRNNTLKCRDIYSIGSSERTVDPIKYMVEHLNVKIYTMYKYEGTAPCKTITQAFGGGSDVEYGEIARYQPTTFPYPFQVRYTTIDPRYQCSKYFAHLFKDETDKENIFPIFTTFRSQEELGEWYEEEEHASLNHTLGDMVMTNVYSIASGINLFYNYSDYMDSHVSVEEYSGSSRNFVLNRIPLVKWEYINDTDRFDFTMSEIKKSMLYVSNSIDKLETLFGVDFKLFNTYGPSKTYNIERSDGTSGVINQVNLSLKFRAQLYTDADKAVIEQIKSDIKTYIENISEIKNVHMPNLVSNITKTYGDYLVYFEYIGLENSLGHYDATYQHIVSNKDMEYLKEVPEFININFDTITEAPDINIEVIV